MKLLSLILIICFFSTPSLAKDPPNYDVEKIRAEIAAAKKIWSENAPSKYSFEFNWNCFCKDDFTSQKLITVENENIIEIKEVSTGKQLPKSDFSMYKTINGLIAMLEDAQTQEAYVVAAGFDQTTGAPTRVSIDYDKRIADEEIGFQVTYKEEAK